MGTETGLMRDLGTLLDGGTVQYGASSTWDFTKRGISRNHLGLATAREALRALRAVASWVKRPVGNADLHWIGAKRRLIAYLRDELTAGLWGAELLATTPHCEMHLAIMAFARLVAVESRDAELLDLTAQHCRAHGRLCATIADPTGQCWSAGWRVRLAKPGKRQDPPTHDGLSLLWRMVNHRIPEREIKRLNAKLRDPLYVGLRAVAMLMAGGDRHPDDLGGMAHEQPGCVPMRHRVLVYRWNGGHQVVIPRGKFKTRTAGSVSANVVSDWCRAEWGKGKRGASAVTFGLEYATDPPGVPGGAVCVEWGPRP